MPLRGALLNRFSLSGCSTGVPKNKVSYKFRQNRIFSHLRFHPDDSEDAQCPGNRDVHPFLVQIGYEPDIGNDHGGSFQTFESEEGVANDVFFGLRICGRMTRISCSSLSLH